MMNLLQSTIENVLKPSFHQFKNGRKQPTRESIVRLSENHTIESPNEYEKIVYLVEVRLGYINDIQAEVATFPGAKLIYVSADGYQFQAITKAEVKDNGKLTLRKGPEPTAIRPAAEGNQLTQEEFDFYKPVLKNAHNLQEEHPQES